MSKFVVIVDDTESLASSLAIAVEAIPEVKALIMHHPETALSLFATYQNIAALVTDLSLPVIDGFQLIAKIRNLHGYERLPAIVVTAEANPKAPNDNVRSAPNAILHKPFSPKEVRRVLQSLLP